MRFLALLQPSQQASRARPSCSLSLELSKMCFLREMDDFPVVRSRGGALIPTYMVKFDQIGIHAPPQRAEKAWKDAPDGGLSSKIYYIILYYLYSKRQPERPEVLISCFVD